MRFTFSAEVEVPAALTAVMAAEQVGVEERDANKVFRFKMPQPIPSYLFGIAVREPGLSRTWAHARAFTLSRS